MTYYVHGDQIAAFGRVRIGCHPWPFSIAASSSAHPREHHCYPRFHPPMVSPGLCLSRPSHPHCCTQTQQRFLLDGQVGATNAMRLEAVAKDGRKIVLKYAHEDLEVCVGIATAAFAVATLRGDVSTHAYRGEMFAAAVGVKAAAAAVRKHVSACVAFFLSGRAIQRFVLPEIRSERRDTE